MSPQEVLLRAADLLEKRGWIQGAIGDSRHGYCVWGAVHAAAHRKRSRTDDAIWRLRHFIPDEFETYWNDQPGQTAENVIATLRRAALP